MPDSDYTPIIKDYEQASKANEALVGQTAAAKAPVIQEGIQAASQPLPAVPNMQPLPKPPQWQNFISPDETKGFMAEAMAMAMIGAAGTKSGLLGAMDAMTGAMKGYRQGKYDNYNKAVQDFKDKMDQVKSSNDELMKQYDAVLKNRELTLAQKRDKLAFVAAQNEDWITYNNARMGNDIKLIQNKSRHEEALAKIDVARQLVQAKMEQMKQASVDPHTYYNSLAPSDQKAIDRAATNYHMTWKLPYMSRSQGNDVYRKAIMMREAELYGGGISMAGAKASYTASEKALGNMISWLASVEAKSKTVDDNMQGAIALLHKVDPQQIQAVNAALLAGKTEILNDPTATALLTDLYAVRNEYARVMSGPTSNAMTPEGAQGRANEMLKNTLNEPAMKATFATMKFEMGNQIKRTVQERDQLKGDIEDLAKPYVPQAGSGTSTTGDFDSAWKVLESTPAPTGD